ncbi:hypothetical protein [Tepidimonas charontis]|jgi:hypothetical protein|uniref:Uncharacterized protein n=1 Tax=Tepidimonas charontis TaxID=2267262 RepID=A0A554XH18_9BURK|nr:hypothetical protein [Tepidimonas charontis]TSE35130.1 hypothetical protein Tchar_00919 [Tepidimonas charontis]
MNSFLHVFVVEIDGKLVSIEAVESEHADIAGILDDAASDDPCTAEG